MWLQSHWQRSERATAVTDRQCIHASTWDYGYRFTYTYPRVGFLCLLQGCIRVYRGLQFCWVSLALPCFLRLSSAGLIIVLIPGICWACCALSV